jgi:hypothetical protein
LLFAAAVGIAFAPSRIGVGAKAAAGFVLAAIGATRLAMMIRARPKKPPPAGWIAVDAKGLERSDASGSARLADWGARFGVTVIANESRDRGLLAFTTAEQTRYVRVRVTGAEAHAARDLFARASIAAESDVMLGARGADEPVLTATDALRLLEALRVRAADALDRILLSDSRGVPVVLDGDELRLGERIIDLRAPLEWRGFMFFETAGQMSTVVQATWVRQAGFELFLVAPMPAEVAGVRRPLGGDVEAERAAARDLRLMQASPDSPPPVELRMAIERLFMVPLRRALDRAPRTSRPAIQRKRPEGHAS